MSIIIPYDMSRKYTEQNTVFPADLTGQADGDYIRNDAGVWKPVTRDSLVIDTLVRNHLFQEYPTALLSNRQFAGTSSISTFSHQISLRTGTTANSRCNASTAGTFRWGYQIGENPGILNWSRPLGFSVNFAFDTTTNATSKTYITLGKYSLTDLTSGDGYGDLVKKGIGIVLNERALSLHVHDGTNPTTSATLDTVVVAQGYVFFIYSDGNGNVFLYQNDVLIGQTTGGPTGNGDGLANMLVYEMDNGATTTNTVSRLYKVCLYI